MAKKKITGGEYGSHSAANKGGRPKKGPWCRFMAVEVAASLGIKEGKNLPSNTRAPGICDITRTRSQERPLVCWRVQQEQRAEREREAKGKRGAQDDAR